MARELNTTAAAVALAWVQSRPGVASTIVGARGATVNGELSQPWPMALRSDAERY